MPVPQECHDWVKTSFVLVQDREPPAEGGDTGPDKAAGTSTDPLPARPGSRRKQQKKQSMRVLCPSKGGTPLIPPELRGNLGVIFMQPPSSEDKAWFARAYMGRLHAPQHCMRDREGVRGRSIREEDVSEHASPSCCSRIFTGRPLPQLPPPCPPLNGERSPSFSYLHATRVGEADNPGPPKAGRRLRQKSAPLGWGAPATRCQYGTRESRGKGTAQGRL